MNTAPMSEDASQPVPSPFSQTALGILRRGPFARYAAGEAISMTGTWMQTMAQSWVMTSLTTQAVWLGMVTFVSSVPMLALTMLGGTMADRHDKRKILIATQVVQIILAAAVGWLVLKGRIQIWEILCAAFLLGISAAFEMPSSAALVPELVARENIRTAIAVDRSIFHGTRLIGPALAGLCIGIWGTASAFFANALSFFALIAALTTISARVKGSVEEEEQRQSGMKAGWDFVRADKPTMAMLALLATTALCIFPFMAVLMPLYGRHNLGLDARYTGFLMAVSGIGSLTGSMGLLSVPRERRLRWLALGAVDIVLALTGLALARTFWLAAPAVICLAMGTSLTFGLANTTVQERAPDPLRGRVSAITMLSFVGVMPLSSLVVPALADLAGMRVAMGVGAAIYALSACWIFAGPAKRCADLPIERAVEAPVEVEV
jgi:MFS family permease